MRLQFGVSTEGKLVTGHILRLTNSSKRTLGDAKDRVKLAFKQHSDEFKAFFLYGDGAAATHQHYDPNFADAIGEPQEGETRRRSIPSSAWNEAIASVDMRARARAWYHVTYSQEWMGRCSTSLAEEQEGDFTDYHDDCSPILVSFP